MSDELLSTIEEAIQNGVDTVTGVKNVAVEDVNTIKDAALDELEDAKDNHLNEMSNHKNSMMSEITTTKELALNEMGTVKSLAMEDFNDFANDISTQQSGAIATVTNIKDNAILDVDLERDMALASIQSQILYLQNFRDELENKSTDTLGEIDLGLHDIEADMANALTNIGISESTALQAIVDARVSALNRIESKLSELDSKQTETLDSVNTAKSDSLGAIESERVNVLGEIQDYLITLDQIRYDLEVQRDKIINDGVINNVVAKGDDAKKQADSAKTQAAVAKINANLANSKALLASEKAQLADSKAKEANKAALFANTQGNIAKERAALALEHANYAKSKGDSINYKLKEIDSTLTSQTENFHNIVDSQLMNYLPYVDTYDEIAQKYPEPKHGDVVQEVSTGIEYRFQHGEWEPIRKVVNVQGNKMIIDDTKPADNEVLWVDLSM